MSMFTICTAFVAEGKLQESLAKLTTSEKNFTREVGVLFRRFFQCTTQPHIIWAITEWESEKHHNDAAQSLMKERRDD
ncbi:MAG: antibiotic biosynthesis monooxygenase, partial [bacterium]